MVSPKSQTATEYLIIVAVVVVIAIIVLSVLGAIPSIGGKSDDDTNRAELATEIIGTTDYYVGTANSSLFLRNNKAEYLTIQNISIGGTNCTSSLLPLFIKSGASKNVICTNINTSDTTFNLEYEIAYTLSKTNATYTKTLPALIGQTYIQGSGNTVSITYWTNITDPTANADSSAAIATDDEGNIYVGGYCNGCGSLGNDAYYIVSFTNDGVFRWENITDVTAYMNRINGLAVDADGNIYATGYCDRCGGDTTWAMYSLSFDSNGVFRWSNITDITTNIEIGRAAAVDSNANVYFSGGCSGCGPIGAEALYTVSFDTNGTFRWSNITDITSSSDTAPGITVDTSDNVYITAYCLSCGGTGGYAFRVISYDENGTYRWTYSLDPTAGQDYAWGIASDSNDNVYVAATCDGCGDIGDDASYIFSLDSDGILRWTNITDLNSASDYATSIAVDSNDNVYAAGLCDGCGDLGSRSHFTLSFDSDGNYRWTNITDPTVGYDVFGGVATDNNNDVIITGSCNGCGDNGSHAIYTYKLNGDDGSQN